MCFMAALEQRSTPSCSTLCAIVQTFFIIIIIIIKRRIFNLERTDIYNLPPRAW